MNLEQLKLELGIEIDETEHDEILSMYLLSAEEFLKAAGVSEDTINTSARAKNAMTLFVRSLYDGIPLPPIFTSIITQIKNEVR